MNTYPTHQQTLKLKYNKINAISTITQFFPVPMSPPSLMSVIWFVNERKWFSGSSLKQHHMKSGFPWLEAPLEDDSHILLKYHFSVACWWRVFWNCGNNRSDEPGSGHGAARGLSELGPRVTGNWRREHEESCNPTTLTPILFTPFFSWREPEKTSSMLYSVSCLCPGSAGNGLIRLQISGKRLISKTSMSLQQGDHFKTRIGRRNVMIQRGRLYAKKREFGYSGHKWWSHGLHHRSREWLCTGLHCDTIVGAMCAMCTARPTLAIVCGIAPPSPCANVNASLTTQKYISRNPEHFI